MVGLHKLKLDRHFRRSIVCYEARFISRVSPVRPRPPLIISFGINQFGERRGVQAFVDLMPHRADAATLAGTVAANRQLRNAAASDKTA